MPFQAIREGKAGRRVEAEGEDRLQVGQVIGAGVLAQYKQAIDVGVDQRLQAGVVPERRQGVFGVFGFDRLAVERLLCAFEQEQ
ncbi:hypothetical protein D3C73_1508410 [compost metagenome]